MSFASSMCDSVNLMHIRFTCVSFRFCVCISMWTFGGYLPTVTWFNWTELHTFARAHTHTHTDGIYGRITWTSQSMKSTITTTSESYTIRNSIWVKSDNWNGYLYATVARSPSTISSGAIQAFTFALRQTVKAAKAWKFNWLSLNRWRHKFNPHNKRSILANRPIW